MRSRRRNGERAFGARLTFDLRKIAVDGRIRDREGTWKYGVKHLLAGQVGDNRCEVCCRPGLNITDHGDFGRTAGREDERSFMIPCTNGGG